MDFGLTDEQEQLQRTARQVLEQECPPAFVRQVTGEPDGFSRRLHGKLAELGFTGLIVPEPYGGMGLGMLDLALVLEEMGRAVVPGPFFSSSALAAAALRQGPAALKKQLLPAIASGTAIGTLAFLEASDRLDSAGIAAKARRLRREYELNGIKMFVADALAADFFIAAFRTSGRGDRGVSLFVVPRDAPGLRIDPLQSVDVTRRVAEVEFRRVRIPAEARLGPEGGGWPILARGLEIGALGIAADCLGGAQRALEMSVEYAKVRTQFGKPIGSFQAMKHIAAEMVADIEPARSLVWHAAYQLDAAPRTAAASVAMAKARLSEVYSLTANRAVQMHGGIGFTWEHDLHFWFKRAAFNLTAFGDPAYHRERVAQLARFSAAS
jgi:alkylation response protein AidB-like acyl-CoA dehydrogenase